MAIIKIMVEGGIVQHQNDSVRTVSNSQRLREAFYKFFSQELDHFDFKLEIEMSGGWIQTKQNWLNSLASNPNTFILVDLDKAPGRENERLLELQIGEANRELVFFMTREMEAWFLNEPEIFDSVFSHLKRIKIEQNISEDSSIKDKDIRDIPKPSSVVKVILGRYFRVQKNGKIKKMKYNKMREGADLLEAISLAKIKSSFPNIMNLIDTIHSAAE